MMQSEQDIHILYRQETGKYAPEQVCPRNGSTYYHDTVKDLVEYIKWLQEKMLYLTQNF